MISTIAQNSRVETRAAESIQTFSPFRLGFNKTLSLEVSNIMTRLAVDEALVKHIAEIIASYRIIGPSDRYEDGMKPKMLDTIRCFVAKQEPINMVVPAYPFKSPNHESKVLGPDPDVGERMTLQHFNSIGARIQQIYPPGGHVTIVSDGPCYNDLLVVSDKEVFEYAKGLHRITESLGLKHLEFTDIFELAGSESSPITVEEYASRIGMLKERLFVSFLPAGYNFDEDIKKDQNALLTYRGYIKFLESDLATFFREKSMGKSAAKKYSSKVARSMIERGKAFSALVARNSPLHVRLSIHTSDNTGKLSVALLPHKRYSNFPVTPWHNTPYLDGTNESLSLGRKPTDSDVTYKVCKDELGLRFLRADVPIYNIIGTNEIATSGEQVELMPLYPSGLKVQVRKDMPISFFRFNVAELAKLHSPIIFEGLDLLQSTSEVTANVAGRHTTACQSSSVLQKEISTKASDSLAPRFVQISTPRDASTAGEGQTTQFGQEQECLAGPLVKLFQYIEGVWCTLLKTLAKTWVANPFHHAQFRRLNSKPSLKSYEYKMLDSRL